MSQLAATVLLHLASSSIFEYFCKLQLNERRRLNKTVSTTYTDNKAHTRKGKSSVALNAKDIFQILQKIQSLLLLPKSVFAATLL